MADKQYKIKIVAEADDTDIKDLKKELQSMQNVKDVKVDATADDSEVDNLQKKVDALKSQKADLKLQADTQELENVNNRIETIKNELSSLKAQPTVDDTAIQKLQGELDSLEQKKVNLEISVATNELNRAKELEESLNDTATVQMNVEDGGLDSASEKIDSLSNKLTGVVGGIGMVDQATKLWEASTSRQFQSFYLGANVGQEQAQSLQKDIQGIVASMPGDDTFMNQLLVTATAQNTQLANNKQQLTDIARISADYMAGSKMMGKMNLESQQDIYKYLLDGNTAELEKGSIVSSQVDKLKDKATIEERILAMNEALNTMGYTGISQYDTATNNLEEFMGNLEKSRADLGELFLPIEQSVLKTALSINDELGGALTGVIAAGQMVVPTAITGLSAIGEMSRGLSALRSGWNGVRERIGGVGRALSTLKNGAVSVASTLKSTLLSAFQSVSGFMKTSLIPALKSAGASLLSMGRSALTSGLNALRSGAMWLIQKAQIVASTVANWAATASQWALNVAMSMNPIGLLVIAIMGLIAVLGYLYFNNEQVRQAVDGFGQALWNVGQIIYGYLLMAYNAIITTLQGLWIYITTLGGLLPQSVNMTGNQIVDGIIAVMLFIATLPLQLAMIFTNIIAKALGFGNNFAQRMISGATNMVTGFINKIRELPGMIQEEFNKIAGIVSNFITTLPQRVWDLGASIVGALKGALGIGSPGHMFYMFEGELTRLNNLPHQMEGDITHSVSDMGTSMVKAWGDNDSFNMDLSANSSNNDSIVELLRELVSQTNGQPVFNIQIDNVDDEERVNRLVEEIRKVISWNNSTAGRRV